MSTETYNYGMCPDDVIRAAALAQCLHGYTMENLSQEEWTPIVEAVNQGIDAHLEAFTRSTFEAGTRGFCLVHPEELHILCRRLGESGDEEAESLRGCILQTLDIEEI